MLGDKRFDVDTDDSILINGIRYVGTPGLYELIFKRMPDDLVYTENDKLTYRNILLTTNAHRRDKKANNPILGNKGYKYRHVIAPLLQCLASPKEDTDATSKSYVDLALRAARKDEIEHRENTEKIASQLRKDADEAGQSVVLLFTRLAQLESVLGKRLDVAESSLSRRLDAAKSSILSINNTIKYTLLPSPLHTLPRREKTEESKESEKPNEKSRIAANSAEKIKKLEELASRLTKESNELEKRI
ncbi:hypothetical protein ACFW04_014399 [Cataglyphis niger]